MFKSLYPKEYRPSVFEIDYDRLKNEGRFGLIFDLDNTVAPFDVPLPDEKTARFFRGLRESGFGLCLLSNNAGDRVEKFNESLGLCAISKAGKPGGKGVKKALALLGADEGRAALIGDQIFTDVWCGNRLGIYTVLVKPMSDRDELSVKLKRGLEKIVIRSYLKKIKEEER